MQGTIMMMVALSGLGCHHKGCAPAPAPACYDSCYTAPVADCMPCAPTTYVAPSCYSDCYSSGYSGCYGGCYGGGYGAYYSAGYSSCYSGPVVSRKHSHRRGLFSCFSRKRSCEICDVPVAADCYGGGYGMSSIYAPAVYGSYTPVYSSGQVIGSGQAAAPATTTSAPPPPAVSEPTPAPNDAPPAPPTPAATTPPAPPAPAAPKPAVPAPAAPKPPAPPAPPAPASIPSAPPAPSLPTVPAAPSLPSVAPPPAPSVPSVPGVPKA